MIVPSMRCVSSSLKSVRPARGAIVLAAAFAIAACASEKPASAPAEPHSAAHKKELTIDALYGEGDKRVDFNGNVPNGLVWLDDEHYLWPKSDPKTKKSEWLRVEAATGMTEPFADAKKAEAAMAAIPGVKKEEAAKLAFSDASMLSKDHTKILLSITASGDAKEKRKHEGSDLFVYAYGADHALRLTNTPDDEEENAQWSPDGKHVSFVRKNDLYVVDLDPVAEHRITNDGGELVLNGKLDWLYQEEVYGRGNFGAVWWSEDSNSIAFLRIDEHGVPPYTLVNDIPWRPDVETSPYPRSGETNPTVKLGVAGLVNNAVGTRWVDLSKYATGDFLIVDVAWSPKNELFFQVQDREQIWLDVNRADGDAGAQSAWWSGMHLESVPPPGSVRVSMRAKDNAVPTDAAGFAPLADALRLENLEITGATTYVPGAMHSDAPLPMHTLFRETSPAWVDNPGSPKWLGDGSFLLASER